MHLRPGRAAVVQGPAWQETTQRSRGEERRGAATMGPGRQVRVAKCQMLVTCFFVLLLSLSMATAMALLHLEDRFAVVSRASLDSNPWEAVHRWVFSLGISLAGLLSLGATLSAAATMREAPGLLATGFLCFALVFCSLVQVALWRFHNPTQVEDAMLDTYDLVYDQAVRSPSSIQWPELAAIQDTFLCCGKRSPFQLLGSREADPCRGEEAAREGRVLPLRGSSEAGHAGQGGLARVGTMCAAPCLGLSAEHQELPEDATEHRLHADQHRPGPHGLCHAAQLLPLLCRPLRPWLGPQRQIHPDSSSLWLPSPGAQPLHTLPGWTCTSTLL
ncbi:tetraspanin-32 isoform X2 [Ictidomys tridecemlineatus]